MNENVRHGHDGQEPLIDLRTSRRQSSDGTSHFDITCSIFDIHFCGCGMIAPGVMDRIL